MIRKVTKFLVHALIKTCKLEIVGVEKIDQLRKKKIPIIYAYWHRHIFVTIYRFKKTGARPLISLSEDGELVSQVAVEFGMNPVRGSSSRGGARAFLAMANTIKEDNSEVLITADGPKGPSKQIKDGTIRLAQKTNSAIVPICWHASREKVFKKTWDQFKIPLPFSKITYAYGEPFGIPADATKEDYPRLKENLKKAIDSLEEELKSKKRRRYEKDKANWDFNGWG
ncbi:MAG: lysophospholipid acyltransferase family protein [Candidatus Aminicenantes bacterium]|nr:MAG: lysophospholipid acyltransferase family protein [Candidatus Aminicenantes bacterium]